ncbi:hypothetical protein PV327_006304 [Microctonus hyperodae]|uniref:Tensin n=1 Tax=Microctonus hyperodae TaxID=165561 RepID=A0AA39KI14_MICHY|nr:hypothetical protein PV327_006304 [Microctonus hyperodae]
MNAHISKIESARFRDTSQQIHKQWQADPTRAFPSVGNATINSSHVLASDVSSPNSTPSPSSSPINEHQITYNSNYDRVRNQVLSNSTSYTKQMVQRSSTTTSLRTPGVGADATGIEKTIIRGRVSEVMELCYITERIIALWYRDDAQGVLEHATNLLRGKHANNYMIFNLSSSGRTGQFNTRECNWPHGLAPSLEQLCALCKELDSWLNAATNRVVVLHARGSKERVGVAISAYMNYSNICGSRDQALDRYAMRKFLDDKIGPLRVPSHRRYIEYFSGLLSGSLRISPTPLYLTHVTVLGVPLFEPTGCRAFLKVYEGLTSVYTSDLYSVTNAREFTVNLGGLRLRGDILIKCYHRIYSKQNREVMFSLQFHTCVITDNVMSFPRSELDIGCDDSRCPSDSVVTLYFATDERCQDGPVPAPTPAVPHASASHDPILHWDSYINLDMSDDEGRDTPLSPPPPSNSSVQTSPQSLGYTCGPIDGSLYAVVQQGAAHCSGGAARGSPLTVSMDSGISSAPPQRPSPPEQIQLTESQVHGDLDQLLHDMMMTVESMPDPPSLNEYSRASNCPDKMYIQDTTSSAAAGQNYISSNPTSTYSTLKDSSYRSYSSNNSTRDSNLLSCSSGNNYGTLKNNVDNNSMTKKSFSPGGNIDFIDEDIPYHARQTSQPFSYGATTDMIKHQKLSSPSLVRKATMRGTAPIVDIDDILGDNSRRPVSPQSPNTPDLPTQFSNEHYKFNVDTIDGLSWLRQQQLKLAARKDEHSPGKIWRQERGNRVIGELRSLQRGRLRHDGYASDSAVIDDDDDVWMPSPVATHQIVRHTASHASAPASPHLPQRSSSRNTNGISSGNGILARPRAESVNERPFVSVKRAYEFRKYNDGQSLPMPLEATMQQFNMAFHHTQFNNDEKRQYQPPKPELRSDSYIKTELLMREYCQANGAMQSTKNIQHFDDFHLDNLQNNEPVQSQSLLTYSNCYSSTINDNNTTTIATTSNNDDEYNINSGILTVTSNNQLQLNNDDNNPSLILIDSLMKILPIKSNSLNNINQSYDENINCIISNEVSSNLTNNINNNDNVISTDSKNFPKNSSNAWQLTIQSNDSSTLWSDRSISPINGGINNSSRPQTPAFPVHSRTPYANNSSPTVTFATDRNYITTNNMNDSSTYSIHHNNNNNDYGGNNINNNINKGDGYASDRVIFIEEQRDISREQGLPPKSPTTQRRLSFPASGSLKQLSNKRWPLTNQSTLFDYSKDRPLSPTNGTAATHIINYNSVTPTQIEFIPNSKSPTSLNSVNNGDQSPMQLQSYNSRRASIHSNIETQEVADVNVKFVRDTSKIWYKPNISREQAISMLKDAAPGTFVVRDSNSFPGAFGLALKVATPPPGAPPTTMKDPANELVRHFLIEPTSRGVRLKGCANEPVFSSLSALVYQHSLMAMALPCQLLLPEPEAAARALDSPNANSTQQLLAQGAACNVLYLFTIDTESLTGPQAIKKAVTTLFEQKPLPSATIVHFKVSTQGITLTDNARKLFFRRHYPTNNISYCGLDSEERTWSFISIDTGKPLSAHRCFGFVSRKPAHKSDNQCHVFAELEPGQPAIAIVNFVNKVMMGGPVTKVNIL